MEITTAASPWMWGAFIALVLALLALDLGVFHRKAHEVEYKEAAIWSVVWISIALLFNALVYHWFGSARAMEFLTGYLVEKSLSVDNIFIILVLFGSFAVPKAHQHRVLFWGILGAILFRGVFIILGALLIQKIHGILYLFGGILVILGVKLLLQKESSQHPEQHPLMKWLARHLPMTKGFREGSFLVKENGRWLFTPLFMVLLAIELTDVVFAVESIPAIFAITSDPFIVFTSNIFAILGMRSLFFLASGFLLRFHYLKHGLAAILGFIGVKLLLADVYKIPIGFSLAAVGALLAISILASLIMKQKTRGSSQKFARESHG